MLESVYQHQISYFYTQINILFQVPPWTMVYISEGIGESRSAGELLKHAIDRRPTHPLYDIESILIQLLGEQLLKMDFI